MDDVETTKAGNVDRFASSEQRFHSSVAAVQFQSGRIFPRPNVASAGAESV
jgi:hypothetical protein